MLKSSFSIILVLTVSMACVSQAAVLEDDAYTYGLWHCDTIDGGLAKDDTSVTHRAANNLTLSVYSGGSPVTLTTGPSGQGQALNFGTNGLQKAIGGVNWPYDTATGVGQEVRVDGWWFFPSVTALPIPVTAGGSGAATAYAICEIGANAANNNMWYLRIDPATSGTLGYANLNFRNATGTATVTVPMYEYTRATGVGTGTVNMTGKWLHLVAYNQYKNPKPFWDPNNYNRMQVTIDDGTTIVTKFILSGRLMTSGSGRTFNLGGAKSDSPYRGLRGYVDEVKVSTRANPPQFAYGPIPYNAEATQPSADKPATWRAAAPFYVGDPRPVTYDVYAGTSATYDGTWVTKATGITATTCNLGLAELQSPPKTYYWRVDTYDPNTGATTTGSIWSYIVDDIAPTLSMGADQVAWLPSGTKTLTLTATAADVDTPLESLTYQWTKLAGPAVTIATPTAKDTDVTFSSTGSYFFKLVVSDGPKSVEGTVRVLMFTSACAAWQSQGHGLQSADFNKDCSVGFIDFATVAGNWAKCNSLDPACN